MVTEFKVGKIYQRDYGCSFIIPSKIIETRKYDGAWIMDFYRLDGQELCDGVFTPERWNLIESTSDIDFDLFKDYKC